MARTRLVAILACGLFVGGCASQGDRAGRDDVRRTQGVFHGRWWNYYERGSSYLNDELYAEAEADFRKALIGRARDAWQARTYGLHFEEFFPNRELGVVLYQLDRFDEAEEFLRRSLDQIDTARGNYFLDLVTRAKIARGDITDATAPTVLASLREGAITNSREVKLDVDAADDVAVWDVRVNGRKLYQRSSQTSMTFEDKLFYREGTYALRVEAKDLADKASVETLEVTVDLTGPSIGIFEPAVSAIIDGATVQLRGATSDVHGIQSITLNGEALTAASGEGRVEFSRTLSLEDGENSFVIAATDVANNETVSMVKVYRGDPNSSEARLWRLHEQKPELFKVASTTNALALLVEAAQGAVDDGVSIRLTYPKLDRPYRHNRTLRIVGRVSSASAIKSVSINGDTYTPLNGSPNESFSRFIPIDEEEFLRGSGQYKVTIRAQDDRGEVGVEDYDIELRPVDLDLPESKMAIAVFDFTGYGVSEQDTAALRSGIEQALLNLPAGNPRFRSVERRELESILTEQQLTASDLTDPATAIEVGRLANAHVFLLADVFDRGGHLEMRVRVVNTETSDVAAILDATIPDKVNTEQIDEACRGIVEQLMRVFPRLSGELLDVKPKADGAEVLLNWTREDGVRPGMYMLVVHEEEDELDEETGIVFEGETFILGRGRLQSIKKSHSRAKIIKESQEEGLTFEKFMPAITM